MPLTVERLREMGVLKACDLHTKYPRSEPSFSELCEDCWLATVEAAVRECLDQIEHDPSNASDWQQCCRNAADAVAAEIKEHFGLDVEEGDSNV